jgi:hypothetical protein
MSRGKWNTRGNFHRNPKHPEGSFFHCSDGKIPFVGYNMTTFSAYPKSSCANPPAGICWETISPILLMLSRSGVGWKKERKKLNGYRNVERADR